MFNKADQARAAGALRTLAAGAFLHMREQGAFGTDPPTASQARTQVEERFYELLGKALTSGRGPADAIDWAINKLVR